MHSCARGNETFRKWVALNLGDTTLCEVLLKVRCWLRLTDAGQLLFEAM